MMSALLVAKWHETMATEAAHMAESFRADPFWSDMQFGSRAKRIRNYQDMAIKHWTEAQRLQAQQ
jgi:hypothetical protein